MSKGKAKLQTLPFQQLTKTLDVPVFAPGGIKM
jgi:hypothetical protein